MYFFLSIIFSFLLVFDLPLNLVNGMNVLHRKIKLNLRNLSVTERYMT